ncbi:MAG: aromatic ring-hydroxylating dioxygenase subunit alpha [Dehalococcoidia bacterium]
MVTYIRSRGDRSIRSLVDLENGLASREIYVNEELYAQELEQIYARAWLFVGHESQVPNLGDFVLTRMGEEEVILTRDRKGVIHVFLNTCAHRGMKVCRYDEGNALVFTCPFHAWTYDTDGRLVGVPHHKDAYFGELDKGKWGLKEVPQMANFHGSIWATWDPKAPSFEDYLGPFIPSVRWAFQASDGEDGAVELFSPAQRWRIPCNWKFPAFSFAGDSAHAAMTHLSVNAAAIGPQGNADGGSRHPMKAPFPAKYGYLSNSELGHGGQLSIFEQPGIAPYLDTWFDSPGVDDYFREMHEKRRQRVGDEYVHMQGASPGPFGGGQFHIWPNATMSNFRILLWHPHGVGVTESWRLYQVDKAAPKHVKDALRHYAMAYCGPAGVTESDDMENWNYAHPASLGIIAQRHPYNFQLGVGHNHSDDRAPGVTIADKNPSEENQRARLQRWVAFMEAGSWDELYPVKKSGNGTGASKNGHSV